MQSRHISAIQMLACDIGIENTTVVVHTNTIPPVVDTTFTLQESQSWTSWTLPEPPTNPILYNVCIAICLVYALLLNLI